MNDRPSFNATSPVVPVPANGSSTTPGLASAAISSHPLCTGILGMYGTPVPGQLATELRENGKKMSEHLREFAVLARKVSTAMRDTRADVFPSENVGSFPGPGGK